MPMNRKALFVTLLTLLLTACSPKFEGVYVLDGPINVRMEFKDGKVQAMGAEYPYVLEGNQVKVQQGPVTLVYVINDDGSLSNEMLGTFKKSGQAAKKAESKSDSGFLSKIFGSTPARTDVSFSKFRGMTQNELAAEWQAVDDATQPGKKNAGSKCSVEADVGAKLGKAFSSATRPEADTLLARAMIEFMLDQALSRPALRDAAKNLGLDKEGIMVATMDQLKTDRPKMKGTDNLVSRVALNLEAEGGLRQGLYKACVMKGSILF